MRHLTFIKSWKSALATPVGKDESKVKTKFRESQYGFRAGRDTVDAIFIVRQIIEKAKEKRIPLHFHFIDFNPIYTGVGKINPPSF